MPNGKLVFAATTARADDGYHTIENIFPTRVIKAGASTYPLPNRAVRST